MGTLRHLPACLLLPILVTALPTMPAPPATAPSATQPATRPTPQRVDELIRNLGADDFKARQAAQKELVSFGDVVLAAVRTARESSNDPEARGRLDAIVRDIERNSVDVPTRVSLRLHDANPNDGFDALARQSGFTMPLWPPNLWRQNGPMRQATVTAELDDVTYWTAMRKLAAQADVHIQSMGGFGGHPTIMQGNNGWATAPETQFGPFLVVATDVTRHHVANLAKAHDVQRDLHVSVLVLPEPKVKVIQADQRLAVDAIEDETGASLLPNGQRQIAPAGQWEQLSPFSSSQYPYRFEVQLDAWRSPIGQRVATFKGSARFRVQSEGAEVVFDDALKAKNVTQTVEGRRVVLQSCTQQGGNYQAEFTIYRDNLDDARWQQLEHSVHDVRLITADGTVYRMEGGGGGGSGKESHWSAYLTNEARRFGAGGPAAERKAEGPVKLVLPFPLGIKDVTVPFEFHDLPIP